VREVLWRLSSASHGRSTALAAGVVVSLLAAGCATPIGVEQIRPDEANRELTASVLTSGRPSVAAQEFLYRLDLSEKYRADPASAIHELHAGLGQADESSRLFALAELSFAYAAHGGDRSYHLACGADRKSKRGSRSESFRLWQIPARSLAGATVGRP
jgi:hypothetical protein